MEQFALSFLVGMNLLWYFLGRPLGRPVRPPEVFSSLLSDLLEEKFTDMKKLHFWTRLHGVRILVLTNCSTLGKLRISPNHFITHNDLRMHWKLNLESSPGKTEPDSSCLSNLVSWRQKKKKGTITPIELCDKYCNGLVGFECLPQAHVSEYLVLKLRLSWEPVEPLEGSWTK